MNRLTEGVAKGMWCPHARKIVHKQQKPGHNMEEVSEDVVYREKCIASKCMMWRWLPLRKTTKTESIVTQGTPVGCCGLGGKP